MLYAFGKFLFKVIFSIFLPMKVRGAQHIPQKGGFILAGNHASFLDPIIFGTACPRTLHFMARDTLFKNPVFDRILRKIHVFPLRREAADLGAIKEALKRLKNNQGLLLFPEGTRSADGTVGEGFEGVGFLARKSCMPVIPAYVKGTEVAWPKGAKFIKPTRIRVIFGEALSFSQERNISDKELTEEVMRRIAQLKESNEA